MRIETDEWMPLAEVVLVTGISQKTLYRIVDRLGVGQCFFGVRCVRRADVRRIADAKMRVGNPMWIASGDEAAEAAIRAVESRAKRVASRGHTAAEKRRNVLLASIGKKSGGRPRRATESQ